VVESKEDLWYIDVQANKNAAFINGYYTGGTGHLCSAQFLLSKFFSLAGNSSSVCCHVVIAFVGVGSLYYQGKIRYPKSIASLYLNKLLLIVNFISNHLPLHENLDQRFLSFFSCSTGFSAFQKIPGIIIILVHPV
jgi:hypothetical protein